MICAYDESYLETARRSLGAMLNFGVNGLNFKIGDFCNLFSGTKVAHQFELGNPKYIAGRSGTEMAYEFLGEIGIKKEKQICGTYMPGDGVAFSRSKEYWTGWALGFYQWQKNISFAEIFSFAPADVICGMYDKYHEIDIRHFSDRLEEMNKLQENLSRLGQMRRIAGYTQKMLAEKSEVPLRTIQQYEQRQKNINNAQNEAVEALAQVIGCRPNELLENK